MQNGRVDLRKGWREMLQIILFILKLIGWILLLILGLLVLVLLAALFTPLRYQVETSCKGKLSTLEAGADFRIFFRLVSGSLRYQDGKLSWNIRAAWIRMGEKAEAEDVEEDVEEKIEEHRKEADDVLEEVVKKEPETTVMQSKDNEGGKPEIRKEKPEPIENENNEKEPEPVEAPEDDQKESLADKIASVFNKIKYTFEQLCAKIKMLQKKVESVKEFLTDEVHQSAFLKCLAELKKMLIRLRPKQIAGEVHFGFEDPSLTGRVLAGVSMLYPYWGDHICCHPDFENKILEGEVSVKGSLRLLPAAVCMWNLLWNKNVRRTIIDVKRFIFN